jgi:hypothetical protein
MPRIIDANSTMGKKIASLISNKGVAPTNTQLTAAASYVSQTVSTTNPNLGVICTAQTFCGTGGTNSVYIHCTDGTSNMLIWHGECEAD